MHDDSALGFIYSFLSLRLRWSRLLFLLFGFDLLGLCLLLAWGFVAFIMIHMCACAFLFVGS